MPILSQTAYANRRARLKDLVFAEHPDCDAIIITDLVNLGYLSGFTGSNGLLALFPEAAERQDLLITDGRYDTQVRQETANLEIQLGRQVLTHLLTQVKGIAGVGVTLGVEGENLSVASYQSLLATAGEKGPRLEVLPNYTAQLRQRKGPSEIVLLKQAAAVADRALAGLLRAGGIAVGRTEKEIAADLEYRMRLKGSDEVSFETIVAAGPNSAKPHHRPTDRELEVGDIVQLDFGATVQGYRSDMSRVFIMGEAAPWQRELHELVLAAEEAGLEAIKAGEQACTIDRVCRGMITDAGYGEQFTHSTGHGVGLDVHEGPALAPTSEAVLEESMLVTVEPGIYLPGRGGMRIEDSAFVTADGADVITLSPKHLHIITP